MKAKVFYLFLVLFLFHEFNFAQVTSNPKWVLLEDLDDRIVYLDTSTTKIKDNQLSVWTQTIYKSPKEFTSLQGKVAKVKTHYLINTLTRRYSTIGTLYYDNDNRIIGESSSPQVTGKEDVFSLPVESNTSVVAILDKAEEYVSRSNAVENEEELVTAGTKTQQWEDASNTPATNQPSVVQKTETPKTDLPKTNSTNTNSNNNSFVTKPITQSDVSDSGIKIYDPVTNTFVDANTYSLPATNTYVNNNNTSNTTSSTRPVTTSNGSYNNSSERNTKNNIWTDGSSYCVQVASYQDKSVAESKAAELKQQGFNAFVVEAYIARKGGTWFRVRVGYFSSLADAETEHARLR
ncbi:MAG: SPOR domain-containing protein [bacterium]